MCTRGFSFLLFVVVHIMGHVMHHEASKQPLYGLEFHRRGETKTAIILEEKVFPELTYFCVAMKV